MSNAGAAIPQGEDVVSHWNSESTVPSDVHINTPMDLSGDMIEVETPVMNIPHDDQSGCSNAKNSIPQATPERGLNHDVPSGKETAASLNNTRMILIAKRQVHTSLPLSDEIPKLTDQSTSSTIGRTPSGKQIPSLNERTLNEATPKCETKRSYRPFDDSSTTWKRIVKYLDAMNTEASSDAFKPMRDFRKGGKVGNAKALEWRHQTYHPILQLFLKYLSSQLS
ncbi:uncharacterized protein LOC114841491 [Diachasma alloeum]|uniref:uncharacterized protein LOC114841491 n=1 Tax=Diachasma alloeum TaxID=454923 RepID=UPI0010FB0AE9|nr:uncharacterized protein LOC114841491 [Diachasma alloeum]